MKTYEQVFSELKGQNRTALIPFFVIGDPDAFGLLSKSEGILPALESAHALAYLVSQKGKLDSEQIAVVNLSGRGDKDVSIVEKRRPMED